MTGFVASATTVKVGQRFSMMGDGEKMLAGLVRCEMKEAFGVGGVRG